MTFASKKAKERNKLQIELEEKLKSLETQLISDSSVLADYNKCKSEWEEILKFKAEEIKFRSKAKWTEDGEKNTKFFLNLEKRNSDSTHIKKLIDKDNREITGLDNIIKEQEIFYNDLYRSKLKHSAENKQLLLTF